MSSLILAFFSLLFLSPLGDIPVFAAPQVKLEAPATVARGDAFVALAVSEEPVTAFNFKWMGKSYAATAVARPHRGGAGSWRSPVWAVRLSTAARYAIRASTSSWRWMEAMASCAPIRSSPSVRTASMISAVRSADAELPPQSRRSIPK